MTGGSPGSAPTSDTCAQAQVVLDEIYATMSGNEKVSLAVEMAEQAKAVTIDGIRARNPTMSESDIGLEWFRLLHGDDLLVEVTARAHGAQPGAG